MITSVKDWFSSPSVEDNLEKIRQTRLLTQMMRLGLFFLCVFVPIHIISQKNPGLYLLVDALAALILISLQFVLKRGRVRLVGVLLLMLSFLWTSLLIIRADSSLLPASSAYLFVFVLAGVLFEKRGFLISGLACSVAILGLALAAANGLPPAGVFPLSTTVWLSYGCLFVLTGSLMVSSNQITQTALQHTEQQLRALTRLVEQSPASIVITNLAGNIEYVNPHFSDVTGYSLADVQGKNPRILKTGLTPQLTHVELWDALTTGQAWHGEFVNRRKDGSQYVEVASIAPILDESGQTTHYLAVQEDISIRKQAEIALRESEEVFRRMFEDHHAVMLLVEPETGRILDSNRSAQEFYGYPGAVLNSMSVMEINTLAPVIVLQELQRAVRNELNYFTVIHQLANGEVRSVDVHSSPLLLNGKPALFSIIHDITQRRQVERALIKSETLYRLLAENVSDVIWVLDLHLGLFRYVSPSVERLRGFSVSEALEQDLTQALSPGTLTLMLPVIPQRMQACEQGFRGFYVDEWEQPCKDGSTVWTETTTRFRLNDSNGHVEVYGVSRNVSDRRKAQDALRANMKHFKDLVENIPVAYHSLDENGCFIDVNLDWLILLGYSREQVIGKPFLDFLTESDRQRFPAQYAEFKHQGYTNGDELSLYRYNGELLIVILTGRIQLNATGRFERTHNIMVDITARKRDEEAMHNVNEDLRLHVKEIEYLQTELREQALHDPLTGLFNRRYLGEVIEREISRAERSNIPLSLIITDIDHFKKINDTYGHQFGDKFLIEIAAMLKKHVRSSDVVCRYGGEEFVLVLPGTDPSTAARHAEDIRKQCLDLCIHHEGVLVNVSMSFGVASFPWHGSQAEEVLIKADKAMYCSKNDGRNRVTVWNNDGE